TAVTVPSRFNKPGGLGIVYQGGTGGLARTLVYNLGTVQGGSNLPIYSTYRIQSNPPTPGVCASNCNTLTLTGLFTVSAPPAVADNIVHMRALYGMDDGLQNGTVTYNTAYTADDGIVDRWIDGTINPDWQRVIAVRVAVLARSALKETSTQGKAA